MRFRTNHTSTERQYNSGAVSPRANFFLLFHYKVSIYIPKEERESTSNQVKSSKSWEITCRSHHIALYSFANNNNLYAKLEFFCLCGIWTVHFNQRLKQHDDGSGFDLVNCIQWESRLLPFAKPNTHREIILCEFFEPMNVRLKYRYILVKLWM